MKILISANVPLPSISEKEKLKQVYSGGWVTSLVYGMKDIDGYEFIYCFCSNTVTKEIAGEVDDVKYYGFSLHADNDYIKAFKKIISQEQPDILHVFGTEFYHSYAMVKAFDKPGKTILHIQGLVSVIGQHYLSNLPYKICKAKSFRDFIKNDSVLKQQKKFKDKGKREIELIQSVNHISGRTDWDLACTKQINSKAKYYKCNEILRDSFYSSKQWNIEECEKYSIFVSQSGYPIKGFHNVIEAVKIIKDFYPNVKVKIAGKSIIKNNPLKESAYAKYLKRMINEYDLNKDIEFLGALNEKQMCEQFLKANVFVSASSIENSPNSVAEAMILGVPVVSSYVGGVMSMIEHGKDGFLYPADAPYMLAHYVVEVFGNDDVAEYISENAREITCERHDKKMIFSDIKKIYKAMVNEYEC